MLKRYLLVLALPVFLAMPKVTQAYVPSSGAFGLGLILGDPTGLSAKYFITKKHAIDGALGFSIIDEGFHLHAAYNWHFWDVITTKLAFPIYVGVGFTLQNRKFKIDKNTTIDLGFGPRGQAGLELFLEKVPVSFFLELALNLYIIPSVKADLDAGIGARYYF